MSLVLDEFYKNLKVRATSFRLFRHWSHLPLPLQSVGVSSIQGEGVNEFFGLVDEARMEFVKCV